MRLHWLLLSTFVGFYALNWVKLPQLPKNGFWPLLKSLQKCLIVIYVNQSPDMKQWLRNSNQPSRSARACLKTKNFASTENKNSYPPGVQKNPKKIFGCDLWGHAHFFGHYIKSLHKSNFWGNLDFLPTWPLINCSKFLLTCSFNYQGWCIHIVIWGD